METEEPNTPDHNHEPTVEPLTEVPPQYGKGLKRPVLIAGIALLLIVIGVSGWVLGSRGIKQSNKTPTAQNSTTDSETDSTETIVGLQLDPNKHYGDKYADGLLPVGDEKFITGGAKKGYVYMCSDNFVPDSQAGAQTRGPWFVGTAQWNINKKYSVNGSVSWTQNISNKLAGDKRVITTNGLPDHVTGTFPVASSDPAYKYDRNPNSIKSQSLTYDLTANPGYGSPQCMGGEVGVMLSGVPIFNGFDAGGRDAGAWEIQDGCEGHPQATGIYHYHTLSSCIKDVGVETVIGFALDGFPITGPKVGEGNFLTTDDLDECHGITSEITLDGKKVKMYHYVMTQDFPYSVSCFRATAIQSPGQHAGGQQGQQPGGMPPTRR
jgi:hypothetical protein